MKFYCTFGCGQPLAGKAQVLIARDEDQARAYMRDTYDNNWCGTYSEEYWNEMKNDPKRYWPLESELDEIDVTNYAGQM